MSLADISREILAFVGTFNIWLVLAIFLMLVIGEFGTSIPYVMETIWILAGFTPPSAHCLSLNSFS